MNTISKIFSLTERQLNQQIKAFSCRLFLLGLNRDRKYWARRSEDESDSGCRDENCSICALGSHFYH